ncbi:MAG: hypothetical protein AMS27_05525 [Bacteroides sp. SM23_62_1]|nr:MAG: hypothetical protein AMS27_05525 [Bacteroides sp. SM23_62_1]
MKKIITILAIFCTLSTLTLKMYAQLEGTYTINPAVPASSTNYLNYTSAINDMVKGIRDDGGPVNGWGVKGHVYFDIADGNYNERITIPEIPGTSVTATVTFRSASGDSTKVKIYHKDPDSKGVVHLNGCDYVIIKNLTIEALSGGGSGRAVFFDNENACEYITLEGNILRGVDIKETGQNYSVVYGATTILNNVVCKNNRIEEGSHGVLLGNGDYYTIEDNIFTGQYYYSLYSYEVDFATISGNIFKDPDPQYTDNRAMYIYGNDMDSKIINNRISGSYRYGIYFYYQNNNNTVYTLVANNFIHLDEPIQQTIYGIYHNRSRFVKYYSNNINIIGSGLDYAFYQLNYSTNSSDLLFRNNIFTCENGYGLYLPHAASVDTSDYNNIYAKYAGYWGGSARTTLADWQSATTMDQHSVSLNPGFVSASDLHVTNAKLDGIGDTTILAEVPKDIDGTQRNTSTPDIGADEFTITWADAGLISVDSLYTPLCPGLKDIYVTLINDGNQNLLNVKINWSVNEIAQTQYSWVGSLPPGVITPVKIGTFDFQKTDYSIYAYTTNANGSDDKFKVNDTASLKLYHGLSGIYTIGGTSPDFETLSDACNILMTNGICGPVTFNIRDGEYDDHIYLAEFPGTNETNTVTFQSESKDSAKVIISPDDYTTVYFAGADRIIIKDLTLKRQDNGYIVQIEGQSDHNQFINCHMIRMKSTSSNYTEAVIYSSSDYVDNHNIFKNNIIENGSYGIYYSGRSDDHEVGTIIENNQFTGQYFSAISLYFQDVLTIGKNSLSTTNSFSSSLAMVLNDCDSTLRIMNNHITGFNNIGIYADKSDASYKHEGLIANNFIRLETTSTPAGIEFTNSNYQNFFNNTINLQTTSASTKAFFITGSSSNISVVNNIFSTVNGHASYIATPGAIISSDYNNLYSENGYVGYWNGNIADIDAWKDSTGLSSHSLSVNPNFLGGDYQVENIALDQAGDTVPAELSADITGASRDLNHPDIGAYEFTPKGTVDASVTLVENRDAPPFCAGSYDVYATIENRAKNNIGSVNVNWSINGVSQSPFSLVAVLQTGEDSTILLGSVSLVTGGKYEVRAWPGLVNGVADSINFNDTLGTTLYGALDGTYTLGGTDPDLDNFTEAMNHLMYGGLCGHPVIIDVRDGIYEEQLNLSGIPGTSDTTGITFRSESGDSSKVILTYEASTQNDNYVINLGGIKHATFEKITFKATGDQYGRVATIGEEVYSAKFKNCAFIGKMDAGPSWYLNLVWMNNSAGDSCEFVQNLFYGGWTAVTCTSNYKPGLVIRDNVFENSSYGIDLYFFKAPVIESNKMTIKGIGIWPRYCTDETSIRNNRIHITGRYEEICTGIFMTNCSGSLNKVGLVANNFITVELLEGTADLGGIYINNVDTFNICYNSINITNTAPERYSTGIYFSSGKDNELMNNIFANLNGGYAIDCNSSLLNYVDTSDFNNYYTSGNYVARVGTTDYSTLSNWRYYNPGMDANSVSYNPYFNSITDLIPNQHLLNDAGTQVTSVTTDIFGTARSANPDIGAAEFDVNGLDAGIVGIFTTEEFLCDGEYHFNALIKNNGSTTLTGATINWSVNGSPQTASSWTGSLDIGEIDTAQMGTFSFMIDTTDLAPLVVKAWTTNPNSGSDENSTNDSNVDEFISGIKGSFTIGSDPSDDFESFTQAIDFLNESLGLCGPVIFNVADGIYKESLTLKEIPGSSETNFILFRSASQDSTAVTIKHPEPNGIKKVAGGNPLVYFNGADYVIFNRIGFEQEYPAPVARYENGSTYNLIANCYLKGYEGSGEYNSIIYAKDETTNPDDYNAFVNNLFELGSYGFYWYGDNSTDEDLLEKGLFIQDNQFINQTSGQIYIQYIDQASILNNYFSNLTAEESYPDEIIYIYNNEYPGYFEISGNRIEIVNCWTGIYVDNVYAKAGKYSLITNNTLSLPGDEEIDAIYINGTDNTKVINNSVHIINSTSSNCLYVEDSRNIEVLNNIFSGADNLIGVSWPATGITSCDYNIYYNPGGQFGYWETYGNILDFDQWQEKTGLDVHSFFVEPGFFSETDLNVCNPDIDGAGTPTQWVTTDQDGVLRNTINPDPGAYEFTAVVNIDLGADLLICPEEILTLDAGPSAGTYLWSTGETARTIQVNTPGTYSVEITISCGTGSDEILVSANTDQAVADFDYTLDNELVIFNNLSTGAKGYLWDFGDGSTSMDINPYILFPSTGQYTVKLIAYNDCKSDSTTKDVSVVYTGISYGEERHIRIYPNPSNGQFTLEMQLENSQDLDIRIFDIVGELVYTHRVVNAQQYKGTFDLSDLPGGVYYLHLQTRDKVIRKPLILQ